VRNRRPRVDRARGQSTVEFALVVPILLVIFLAIADFGRIFAAGIVVEAAARDAAEIAAIDYYNNPPGTGPGGPGRLASPAPNPGDPAYYDDLNAKAARTVCVETRGLPNSSYRSDGTCPDWPIVRVCVHDAASNNSCGQPISPGYNASTPSECDQIPSPGAPSWDSAIGGGVSTSGAPQQGRYVEVRVCYPFTTIMNVPILPNRIAIQRVRYFTVACFQDPAIQNGC